MNILGAFLVIILVMCIATLVYFIGSQSYEISGAKATIVGIDSDVTEIKSEIKENEDSYDENLVTIANAILSTQSETDQSSLDIIEAKHQIAQNTSALRTFSDDLKTNLQSRRLSLNNSASASLTDALSVSRNAPSASLTAPKDSTYLHVTDGSNNNYSNLGVGTLWADKGVSMAQGACVDFGNGASMCGNNAGVVSGRSSGAPLSLAVKGASAQQVKNQQPAALTTNLPGDSASSGKNRIVGDTILTADLMVGGNTTVGNSGAVGAGIISSSNGSHVYSGMDSTTAPATMSVGFAHRPTDGTIAQGGSDLLRMTRTQNQGNSVKILGTLQICDDAGNNCLPVLGATPAKPPTAGPFINDTSSYSSWA